MIKLRPPATHEQLQHAGEGEIDEGEKHLPMLSEPQPTFVSRAGTVIFTPLTEAAPRTSRFALRYHARQPASEALNRIANPS
jgi:hypothetical protein